MTWSSAQYGCLVVKVLMHGATGTYLACLHLQTRQHPPCAVPVGMRGSVGALPNPDHCTGCCACIWPCGQRMGLLCSWCLLQVRKQAHDDLQSWVQCDECGKWRTVPPAVLAAIEAAGEGATWACAQVRLYPHP